MAVNANPDANAASAKGKRGEGRRDRRTRPARAQAGDARAELLAAAAEVFAERGYRAAGVDEIAARAGYSKGALYWHFRSKDELFFALMDASVDAPAREMVALLQTAPAERDMAPEASRRFVELVARQRELLLLDHEYWALAAREPALRERYAARRERLREALAAALEARLARLGAPVAGLAPREMATVLMCLSAGLAEERLVDERAVGEDLLGRTVVLLYRGLLASAGGAGTDSGGAERPEDGAERPGS
ncbi:MAG TPA: helix-turn-helix domain-containing protein [Solirubrobacteraceae bacterium]|nr:helix-turn-helix domain-containing protein [Solirubrobacteraceae bacterium]